MRETGEAPAPVAAPGLEAALMSAVVENAPDGILIIDESGRMVLANRRVEELFGYDRDELLGASIEILVPDELRSAHSAHRARYGAAPASRPMGAGLQLAGQHRNGARVPVEISLSPVATPSGRFTVAIVRDISERVRSEEELRAAQEDLALLADRERIARDLHDTVLQRIFATGLTLQAAALRTSNPDARERIDRAVADLDTTIREIRTAIFSLHGSSSEGSLRQAVLTLAAEAARPLGFAPSVRFAGPVDSGVPGEVTGELPLVLREALSNVARHARATRLEVDVVVTDDAVRLQVNDDGVGLSPGAARAGGRGLVNMDQRARSLGGACQVSTPPGGGTVVDWHVPRTDSRNMEDHRS